MTFCGRLASAAQCQHADTATADVPAWRVGQISFPSADHAQPAAVISALLSAELALETAPSEQAVSTSPAILVDESRIESAPMPDADAAEHDTPQPSTQVRVYEAVAAVLGNPQPSERPRTCEATAAETVAKQPGEQRQAHATTATTSGTSEAIQQFQGHEATAGVDAAQASEQHQVPEAPLCPAAGNGAVTSTDADALGQVRPVSTSCWTLAIKLPAARCYAIRTSTAQAGHVEH